MKKLYSNVLLIVMKDGSRTTYSVPDTKDFDEVYKYSVKNGEIKEEDVEKLIYFPNTPYPSENIQYYYDDKEEKFDNKSIAIKAKIDEFRKNRTSLFKALDMEFMKTLENRECVECTDHVVEIKKHMRDMPDILVDYFEELEAKEVSEFDCFNNLYRIGVLNGGSGYETAPEVTVGPTNGRTKGMQMLARAVVEDGKVTKIITTRVGSGYLRRPSVNIAKSDNGNTAIAIASDPENDIFNIEAKI